MADILYLFSQSSLYGNFLKGLFAVKYCGEFGPSKDYNNTFNKIADNKLPLSFFFGLYQVNLQTT